MKNLKNEKIGMTHDGMLKEVVGYIALIHGSLCINKTSRIDTKQTWFNVHEQIYMYKCISIAQSSISHTYAYSYDALGGM